MDMIRLVRLQRRCYFVTEKFKEKNSGGGRGKEVLLFAKYDYINPEYTIKKYTLEY